MYPKVADPEKIGSYGTVASIGGGFVWDAVLEYRVWCHLRNGVEDIEDGNDYFHAFEHYEDALKFSKETKGAEQPLALVLQEEYIDEPEQGVYQHVKEQRITEWPVEFLSRPQRSENTITDFLAADAPENRLDIIRGVA